MLKKTEKNLVQRYQLQSVKQEEVGLFGSSKIMKIIGLS